MNDEQDANEAQGVGNKLVGDHPAAPAPMAPTSGSALRVHCVICGLRIGRRWRKGSGKHYWTHEVGKNKKVQCCAAATPPGPPRFSDAQVLAWIDRNHFDFNIQAARLAMEDAATLIPEQNTQGQSVGA